MRLLAIIVYGNLLSQLAQVSPDFSSDGPLSWETPGSLANRNGWLPETG